MGENIHIHYRDLRIELSVPEFLEFAEAFERCAPAVKNKISEGYKDGVLPNTNESNTLTTFALDAPLKHPVKYSANRISIEENLDGYHIHFRNYKLLFDKRSFDNILQAMNDVVERRDSQRSLDEVLHLIRYNDLEYRLIDADRNASPNTALVEVKPQYLGKIKQMFNALGFSSSDEAGIHVFHGDNMKVHVRIGDGKEDKVSVTVPASPYVLLADYLTAMKGEIAPKEVNLLMLQVLNAFGMVRSGENPYINLDFRSFLLDRPNQRVIFQSMATPYSGDLAQDSMKLSRFMHSIGLFLAKPNRILFSEDESKSIKDIFMKHMLENVAAHPCVNRIYVLGSSTRNNLGKYEVPLVHFDWAKLASDFDVLVEIDEQHAVPDDWQRMFFTDYSGCYYYHLGDLPHQIESSYIKQYPNVKYFNHLIEAYLFFPSNCDMEVKDRYLSTIKAELIYEKAPPSSEKDASKKKLVDDEWIVPATELMRDGYGIDASSVSKIDFPSHNYIYKVEAERTSYVVKIFSGLNFTPLKPGGQAEHFDYEDEILRRLEKYGMPVVPVIRDLNGRSIHDIGSRKAMVFRYIDGSQFNNSLAQIARSAETLAKVHRCLPEDALSTTDFDYKAFVASWVGRLPVLREKPRFDECIHDADGFVKVVKQVESWLEQAPDWQNLVWVHGHGDVNPRNFLFQGDDVFMFDFQAARFMPRLADIADGMIEFGIFKDALAPERMGCFLEHYEAIYPLSEVERNRIKEFLLADAIAKIITTLESEISHGYKVSPNRMKALLDFCLK